MIRNKFLRDLPSHRYREDRLPEEFRAFFDSEVWPLLNIAGKKLNDKKQIATHATHKLVKAWVVGACVADTRRTSAPGVRLRAGAWDAIVAAGLAIACVGSESAGAVTRYRATQKLIRLAAQLRGADEVWELRRLENLELARNTMLSVPTPFALVLLHSGYTDDETGELLPEELQRQPLSIRERLGKVAQRLWGGEVDPKAVMNGMDYFRAVEDTIEHINRSNVEHTWKAFGVNPETGRRHVFQPNPCLRQVHVGEFFRAVRLYSFGEFNGQNLPKVTRRTILIDDEPVAELDYSCMATRMLYHFGNIDPPADEDLYRPDVVFPEIYNRRATTVQQRELVREFVKGATNRCWNVSSRSRANSSVGKLLAEHPERDTLQELIYDVAECGVPEIVRRIMDAHPALADRFFTEIGLELMTTDGKIMLAILTAFAEAGKPVLSLHDAVVCRVSDVDFARRTMEAEYRRFMRFSPVINRVF